MTAAGATWEDGCPVLPRVSAAPGASQLSLRLDVPPQAGKPPQGLTTATILGALQRHYRKPGTGIDVHEVKVSRADWLRELDEPAKAEAWWPHCNRFWVVAVPGIVVPAELPEGWGLMELPAAGRRFKIRVPAVTRPVTLTVGLLVELLRRADNQRLGEMDQMRRQHDNDMYKLAEQRRAEASEATLPPGVKTRLDMLTAVETALGMPLDEWGGWPKLPPSAIKAAELAAFLTDVTAHVTLQRRADGPAAAARVRDDPVGATARDYGPVPVLGRSR